MGKRGLHNRHGLFRHRLWHFPRRRRFRHRRWRKVLGNGIPPAEGDHAVDVSLGKALEVGEFVFQFQGKAGNDGGAPTLLQLPIGDDSADVSAEADEFAVDGQHRPRLGRLNAALHIGGQRREVGTADSRVCRVPTRQTPVPSGWWRWRWSSSLLWARVLSW